MAEKEYIERSKAIEAIDDACGELNYSAVEEYNIRVGGISDGMGTAIEIIEAIPAADVRPVVLCRDCRHRDPEDHKCDSGEMERQGCPFKVADNYFCAYGER